jgi:predicted PolB exonuclease-like 3'-5' exonuclease
MRYIALDIETVPLKIEDPMIIQYLMDKKIGKERRNFDPNYTKIIAIGVKTEHNEPKVFMDEDESKVLADFWGFLEECIRITRYTDMKIVTHNGYKFDLPFIIVRSYINGLEPTVKINMNRWRMEESNHFDLMLFFSQYELFTNISLKILCRMHGIEVMDDISGADVEACYKREDLETIRSHCANDVTLTARLFEKIFL